MISLRLPARYAEHAIGNRGRMPHEGILRVVRPENGRETYRLYFIPHGRTRRSPRVHSYVAIEGHDEMLDMLLGCVMPDVAREDTVSARDWIRRKLAETGFLEFSVQLDDLRHQRFRT
jgi:hypothetical protein